MRSTRYTFAFAAAVCVVCSLLVSTAATVFRERQEKNVRIDRHKNILRAVGFHGSEVATPNVEKLYGERITALVVDAGGRIVEGKTPEDLDPAKDAGLFPVFVRLDEGRASAYAFPVSGKGLWSTLYGYLAIRPDGKTVQGITFYKHGETPGLGAEIEQDWFRRNFEGKTILHPDGSLASIVVVKGKVSKDLPPEKAAHRVDGISGATMTGQGVTKLIRAGLEAYGPFLAGVRAEGISP